MTNRPPERPHTGRPPLSGGIYLHRSLLCLVVALVACGGMARNPLDVPWLADVDGNLAHVALDLIAPWEQWFVIECNDDPPQTYEEILGMVCMFVATGVVDLAEHVALTLTSLPDLEGYLDWPDPWDGWRSINMEHNTFILRHWVRIDGRSFVISIAEMEPGKVSLLTLLWVAP